MHRATHLKDLRAMLGDKAEVDARLAAEAKLRAAAEREVCPICVDM